MFGKIFATTFTGSMFGAGPDVFAVWAYTLANTGPDSHVELNPKLLAVAIGSPEDRIKAAIEYLCNPDPNSRTKESDGRRLLRQGEFLYQVVNHAKYRSIRDEEDRRTYFREAKRRQRQSQTVSNGASKTVKDSQGMSTMSTHTEAEEDSRERALSSLSYASTATKSKKLSGRRKEVADKIEAVLGDEWVNDATKWVPRITGREASTDLPGVKSEPEKVWNVAVETLDAAKAGRIKTTRAAYAEDYWKRLHEH